MSARLTQVQVTDFRSIRGTVTVPLDAPVVLVHGPNGSGKTSLLSAIELGLTGAVGSLKRFDDAYTDNLVHYDAVKASISVNASHDEIPNTPAEVRVRAGEIEGTPLLSRMQSRFFTERSLLSQATLSRLLEIYEASDARKTASPLTRFVNDLLGLDQLDSLVEGLHPTGDKRRLVKSLPLYGEAIDELAEHDKYVTRLADAITEARTALGSKAAELTEALGPFGVQSINDLDDDRSQLGDSNAERRASVEKAALRRDIEAALSVWRRIEQQPGREQRAAAEAFVQDRQETLAAWENDERLALEVALSGAAALYADLPPARSVGWVEAHREAVEELSDEFAKADGRLTRDEMARKELIDFREALNKAKAREGRLDESLGTLATSSGEMAQALSQLAPLVDSEICPVCRRDFSEVGTTSLRTHLATHISSLSQTASRLRSVAEERQTVRMQITQHQRNLSRLEETVLDGGDLAALRHRRANLGEALRRLQDTADAARRGDALSKETDQASQRLAILRRDEEALRGLRASVLGFAQQLSLQEPSESEALGTVLERYLVALDQVLAAALRRDQERRRVEAALEAYASAHARLSELERDHRDASAKHKSFKDAIKATNGVRGEIRKLSDRAVEARTAVVREVFNESLNRVWNNLFIRLAPEEPFLPVFELPDKGRGPVEAKLTTRYRGKDQGGNPKAMLSAGNLNTAALTLFLSLHLSVKPLLPWLVIDDPVQSMDEIHIAQFAALLRTLARQQGRQVVIAVHERPLFEYLALELSPASPGDKLITVELSKDAEGRTICDPKPITWNADAVYRAEAV
ncbi:AAA family ATPase [Parvularcula dongshanensis]|uniref:Exonuclease SbcC n=1 Tax=Parvularcula dongshanensis TaxID=1173995 RepID=A0A840I631_9PROT|nr:AAA family ATPase [Parvularcula dongshanensis]MBB4659598.1 exonuclease SbcC [Parvularcula dongshanensis]